MPFQDTPSYKNHAVTSMLNSCWVIYPQKKLAPNAQWGCSSTCLVCILVCLLTYMHFIVIYVIDLCCRYLVGYLLGCTGMQRCYIAIILVGCDDFSVFVTLFVIHTQAAIMIDKIWYVLYFDMDYDCFFFGMVVHNIYWLCPKNMFVLQQ